MIDHDAHSNTESPDNHILPPRLCLCLCLPLIPEFWSSSFSSLNRGDRIAGSRRIVSETFSSRSFGGTPVRPRPGNSSELNQTEAKKSSRWGCASSATKVMSVLDEAANNSRLQPDAFFCVGVHLLCTFSTVEEIGSQDYGQVSTVHLILCAPGIKRDQKGLIQRESWLKSSMTVSYWQSIGVNFGPNCTKIDPWTSTWGNDST